jgi:CRISPR type III-A-associated RAMP protein Csm4
VPVEAAASLIAGEAWTEEGWTVEPAGQCLLPRAAADAGGLRESVRSAATVDRVAGGGVAVHQSACVEFTGGAGFWLFVEFSGEQAQSRWLGALEGAFRWLAESGIGGERSNGWGRFEITESKEATLADLIPLAPADPFEPPLETAHWLLSLFSPGERDSVVWERGAYSSLERRGWVDNREKMSLRMVEEGSVLFAASAPAGSAPDVAPEGSPHPAFRNGFAVSLPIPWRTGVRAATPEAAA